MRVPAIERPRSVRITIDCSFVTVPMVVAFQKITNATIAQTRRTDRQQAPSSSTVRTLSPLADVRQTGEPRLDFGLVHRWKEVRIAVQAALWPPADPSCQTLQ